MRNELNEKILQDFPQLFERPIQCECGDGWFLLIYDLCQKITPLAIKSNEDRSTIVVQIKEKFGGLRFYVSCATDVIYELISEAENASRRICEHCGQPGKTTGKRWFRTLCDGCERSLKSPG